MPYVSKPMKLVTVWFTEEEKARLDQLARDRSILEFPHTAPTSE